MYSTIRAVALLCSILGTVCTLNITNAVPEVASNVTENIIDGPNKMNSSITKDIDNDQQLEWMRETLSKFVNVSRQNSESINANAKTSNQNDIQIDALKKMLNREIQSLDALEKLSKLHITSSNDLDVQNYNAVSNAYKMSEKNSDKITKLETFLLVTYVKNDMLSGVLNRKVEELFGALRNGGCPDDSWRKFRGKCYKVFMPVEPTVTRPVKTAQSGDSANAHNPSTSSTDSKYRWTQGRDKCISEGGRLAEIHDSETNWFIFTLVNPTKKPAWIGLSDYKKEGEYVWEGSSKPLAQSTYSNFNKAFLKKYPNADYDYAAMLEGDGRWIVISNNLIIMSCVCEKEPKMLT